jgi:hypothetical protein
MSLICLQKHGSLQVFPEWSQNYGDYRCLERGLRTTGKADLMPPQPNKSECPLAGWREFRTVSNLSSRSFPLALGRLHRITFPERLELSKHWHNAGADVIMTIQLIRAYFDRARNRPIEGKIMTYFPMSQKFPNLSGREEFSEEPTSVDDNDEDEEDYDEDEECYDELPDAEMHYLYDEQGSLNEDALEHMVDTGLISSAEEEEEEEEEWHERGLDEYATL